MSGLSKLVRLPFAAAPLQGPRWKRLACLVALFAVVFGARLWLVDDFGSPVPFWDEWDCEGGQLFKPYLTGHLAFSRFFTPQNEHRIVLTRLLEVGLLKADGMWDPPPGNGCQCDDLGGDGNSGGVSADSGNGGGVEASGPLHVAGLWVLPYASENTLWGFQSQFFFLVLFSFLALWGLCHGPPFTGRWWVGTASLVLATLSLASGLLAGLAVAVIRCWAVALDRRAWRTHWLTLLAGLLCAGIALMFAHHVPENETLYAQGPRYFLLALFRCLSWPAWRGSWPAWKEAGAALVFLVPLFVSARALIREKGGQPARWLVLSLAIWAGMQAGALAYGRGGHGEGPASRYQDILSIGFLASCMALLLEWPRINRWLRYVWMFVAIYGFVQGASRDFRVVLPEVRQRHVEQLRRCRGYVETGDLAYLSNPRDRLDIPYPKAERLAGFLDDPQLRSILLFIPGHEGQAGWATHISESLLKSSRAIFWLGILGWTAILWPRPAAVARPG